MTNPSKIFDGLLVLRYRSGEKKAFGILVSKYHKKLCKHSYWYTHDIEASKDIVQDCWSVIIKKLDSLKDPNLFGSWAFRIVTRKSLDFVNKRKRDLSKRQEYGMTNTFLFIEKENKPEIQKLMKGIQDLSKEQQVVLRLFYTENYSLKEMSEILSISIGTVKSRLFHAREKLKIILK
ncbi:MAG: RNA polymerase sigma factor [Maribacter sp.]